MRLLFEMDKKDYDQCTHVFKRDSARSIIIRDGRVAMVYSVKFDHYKFPGGGIENKEDPIEAMIRETREEAGLEVIPDSIKEYGFVHRIEKSEYDPTECFVQDNYYYLCEVMDNLSEQQLDDYEKEESYTLEYVEALAAIRKNRQADKAHPLMLEREAKVLEMLMAEGLL
ncbi:MAG: NUDIX domain-containing protein [Erysipelotrichaceae bacterium]|nr:NUDIX domain-containing protein [Erysipelotrichaceae bacterium]